MRHGAVAVRVLPVVLVPPVEGIVLVVLVPAAVLAALPRHLLGLVHQVRPLEQLVVPGAAASQLVSHAVAEAGEGPGTTKDKGVGHKLNRVFQPFSQPLM